MTMQDCMDFQCMVIKKKKGEIFFVALFLFVCFFLIHNDLDYGKLDLLGQTIGNDIPCITLVMVWICTNGWILGFGWVGIAPVKKKLLLNIRRHQHKNQACFLRSNFGFLLT